MTLEQPKMVRILPEKNWGSSASISSLKKLSSKEKSDLCTIFLDVRRGEPEVLEVFVDVFQNQTKIILSSKNKQTLREIWGTLAVKSNPELMECIRQSQIAKKKGEIREFEDIARECGLEI